MDSVLAEITHMPLSNELMNMQVRSGSLDLKPKMNINVNMRGSNVDTDLHPLTKPVSRVGGRDVS